MDEVWLKPYEENLLQFINGGEYKAVGYVSRIACRSINENTIELSWYLVTRDRFHEVSVSLPKDQVAICVESSEIDEKPHIFVKSEWLEKLYLKYYSIFCMVDAIEVKKALEKGNLPREKLIKLRDMIDDLGKRNPGISFISFADSILIKSNWTVETDKNEVGYTYKPEIFIEILTELKSIYKEILGLEIYAILTQGSNEYYDDALLHISNPGNQVSLNSLGVPFADLMSIENSVRNAINDGTHDPSELYIDENLYHSFRFSYEFRKNEKPKFYYKSKMRTDDSYYFTNDIDTVRNNLRDEEQKI